MKATIRRSQYMNGIALYLYEETARGNRHVKKISLELSDEILEGAYRLPDPTLEIPMHDAISLIESLKQSLIMEGLMPNPSFKEGELKATKAHLADMQKLVFK